MLDYASLEALAAVVRLGSFDKAAKSLHVTASAVSQRVKLLEDKVGKVLVVRAQPCVATAAGAALCRHAESVAMLEHELALDPPGESKAWPVVRIAVNADSVATWFVSAVAHLGSELNVLFDIVIDDQDHTAELLRQSAVQAAVTTLAEPVRGCRVTPLGRLRFIAACSPRFYARYFANGVTKAAMMAAPCLVFDIKDQLQHRFIRRILRTEITPPTHHLPTSHGFVTACLADMAWGMHAESLIREHLTSGALVEVMPGKPVDVRLYWQRFGIPSAIMDAVTGAVTTAARSLG